MITWQCALVARLFYSAITVVESISLFQWRNVVFGCCQIKVMNVQMENGNLGAKWSLYIPDITAPSQLAINSPFPYLMPRLPTKPAHSRQSSGTPIARVSARTFDKSNGFWYCRLQTGGDLWWDAD